MTVIGQTPVLQTERASVAVLVDERAMQDLPLNGRNFVRLAQLTPGATEGPANSLSSGNRPDDRRQSSAIAVNGQDTSQNNFLIDGLDNNERFIGTVIIRPQVDSIREMRIETSSFSAELGRTAGGVINVVTKSGTNVIHGSAFEFYRNEAMDAKNFFAKSIPKPRFDQNQFGGSLGGPIVKDKTFFFADYAGLRLKQGETRTSTVPNMAIRSGNFAGRNTIYDPTTGQPFPDNVIPQNRIDAAARNLVNLWPAPTSDAATNNFVYAPVKTQEDDSFDVRLDHRFNESNALFARYSYNNATHLPSRLAAAGRRHHAGWSRQLGVPGHVDAEAAGDPAELRPQSSRRSSSWRSRADSRATTRRRTIRTSASGRRSRWAFPASTSTTTAPGSRASSSRRSSTSATRASFRSSSATTWCRAAASLTYVSRRQHAEGRPGPQEPRGARVAEPDRARHLHLQRQLHVQHGGAWNRRPVRVVPAGPAVEHGAVEVPRQAVLPDQGSRHVSSSTDRRAAAWLTINAGLRWDLYTEFTEKDDQIANLDMAAGNIIVAGEPGVTRAANVKNDMNNFSPRFGMAATINPQTVLRGGYGISYMPLQLAGGAFRNPPFISLLNISPPSFAPQNRLSDGLPQPAATSATNPTGNLAAIAFDVTGAVRPPVQHRAAARTAGQRGRADRLRWHSRPRAGHRSGDERPAAAEPGHAGHAAAAVALGRSRVGGGRQHRLPQQPG